MPNTYRIVEQILEEQAESGRFDIYFTTIDSPEVQGEAALETISDYVADHLEVSYEDINGAPALPPDTNNESPAYEGTSDSRQIKGFNEIAFTGDYNDLINKIKVPADTNNESPAYETVDNIRQLKPLSELAFTGSVDISNLQVSNFVNLINMPINNENNSDFSSLGSQSIFIQDVTTNSQVASVFREALIGFRDNKRPTFFVTESGSYFVLNASSVLIPVENASYVERGYKFDLALVSESILSNEFVTNVDRTSEQKSAAISQISFANTRQVVFIYDTYDHGVYCKVKEETEYDLSNISVAANNITGKIQFNQIDGLEDGIFSGAYADLSGTPNLDVRADNSSIIGLADIAKTGSYDDLVDTFYSINFGDFIYRSDNNTWITITENDANTGTDYEVLVNCGIRPGFIKNINQLYNSMDGETAISLINKLEDLWTAFSSGKICYLKNGVDVYTLITEVQAVYNNFNQMSGIILFTTPSHYSNYFTELSNLSVLTDSDIEDVFLQATLNAEIKMIIVDFNTNILYSKPRSFYPININDEALVYNNYLNKLGVQISSKANNKLELITTTGEEGLYVDSN